MWWAERARPGALSSERRGRCLWSRAARCGDDNYYTSRLVYLLCAEEAQIEREREVMSVEQRAKRIGGEKVLIWDDVHVFVCAETIYTAPGAANANICENGNNFAPPFLSLQHFWIASAGPKWGKMLFLWLFSYVCFPLVFVYLNFLLSHRKLAKYSC